MTLLYDDGRQGEINLIASQDSIIHLGNIDFENLTLNFLSAFSRPVSNTTYSTIASPAF